MELLCIQKSLAHDRWVKEIATKVNKQVNHMSTWLVSPQLNHFLGDWFTTLSPCCPCYGWSSSIFWMESRYSYYFKNGLAVSGRLTLSDLNLQVQAIFWKFTTGFLIMAIRSSPMGGITKTCDSTGVVKSRISIWKVDLISHYCQQRLKTYRNSFWAQLTHLCQSCFKEGNSVFIVSMVNSCWDY
jgi:hypothetical protein